ncbi:hypothetical protein L3V86_01590 [Thiotrichales bacterium 19S11-10]|nr:hypothetical protein [Thiotrichales bacterium 19S11-10]
MKKIIILFTLMLGAITSVYANETSDKQNSNSVSQTDLQKTDSDADQDTLGITAEDNANKTWWEWVKGQPQENSIYLGMFTLHFSPGSIQDDNWNNELIGGTYKGVFAGTLINSFYKRAYVLGLSRDVYEDQLSDNWKMNSGYRVGLITGYDLDLNNFTSNLPALPFAQIYTNFTYHDLVGVEFSYVGIVVTAEFYIRF